MSFRPFFRLRLRPVSLLACAAVLWIAASSAAVYAAARNPAYGPYGMVVSSQVDATLAGVQILESGGNAIDAAVATAFAVGVTQPFSTGIGGGAFVLIRTREGEVFAIDCRETAPAAAGQDMYVRAGVAEDASVKGPLAVATPGLVAGLLAVQERFGLLSREAVLRPAIRLAAEGFPIGPYHARMIEFMRPRIAERFPETARIQFPPEGETARPGWELVQEDLGRTLRRIADLGLVGFYSGPVAQAIEKTMAEQGGILGAQDLADYRIRERAPVVGTYRDLRIHSFPPPSSGGVALIETLNLLEPFPLSEGGPGSSATLHRVAEAMKLAFADRASFLGDPDFVDVPVERLLSKDYAASLRRRFLPVPWFRRAPWSWGRERAARVPAPGRAVDDAGTTHLSVTDRAGNAVAITQTINTPYGSGITVPGTGIILNNEMDDFAKAIGVPNAYGLVDTRGANAIAPGKRPLSSMTPTIVTKDGKLFMVTGSPGGPRIISTTLLTILNVVEWEMDVQQAVSAPRYHHQWQPDVLFVEPAVPEDVVKGLRRRGHTVRVGTRNWSAAEAIVVDPESGAHLGGNDPRRDGLALGPALPASGRAGAAGR